MVKVVLRSGMKDVEPTLYLANPSSSIPFHNTRTLYNTRNPLLYVKT